MPQQFGQIQLPGKSTQQIATPLGGMPYLAATIQLSIKSMAKT